MHAYNIYSLNANELNTHTHTYTYVIFYFIYDFALYMQVRMSRASFRDLAQSLFVLLFGARY